MTSPKITIQAESIITAVTEQNLDQPIYVLRNAQVQGKLDLRHRTVLTAVDIQDCEFLEEVDVKYCEFTQAVNLSHCIFHENFNSIDGIGANTIYRKNLVCDAAIFKKEANFNGARIEGSAYFVKATFEGAADFSWMKCNTLACNGATFEGPTNFNTLRCEGSGLFRFATFQNVGVSFAFASFDENLEFQGSTFRGAVTFNTLKCRGSGHFTGVQFLNEHSVNFGHASFDVNLNLGSVNGRDTIFAGPANFQFVRCSVLTCNGTIFCSSVDFSMLSCTGGFFRETEFQGQGEVNFGYASISGNLECDGSTFQGPANFNALDCGGSGFFDDVKFLNEGGVDVSQASFGRDLSCKRTETRGFANFNRLKCEGSAWFDRAQFESNRGANFAFARLGSTLRLIDACFSGPVDLSATRISQSLTLTDGSSTTHFHDKVSLYAAMARVLIMEGNTIPFRKGKLDLREFAFERFLGSEQQALRLAEAQDPAKFSRDPYVQLESYYESVGKDTQARDAHYRGRLALRDNATRTGGHIADWSPGRKVTDWLLKVLTGYGVYTGRTACAIVILVALGTVVFSLGEIFPVGQALSVSDSLSGQDRPPPEPTAVDGFFYSVDRLVPINMGVEADLEPQRWWSEAYGLAHAVVGWLLVALFLASWTGLVRRRNR